MEENKDQDKNPIVIMSGLPGKMPTLVAETLLKQKEDFFVSSRALTGEGQPISCDVGGMPFYLCGPEKHEELLNSVITQNPIIVDFTQPDAVNRNAELYCKYKLPFVMGTTGGDRSKLEQTVVDSGNTAVIAPNMAKPIVLMQAMLDDVTKKLPGALSNFSYRFRESHQAAKQDVSGTALAFSRNYFDKLAIPLNLPEKLKVEDVSKLGIKGVLPIRNKEIQLDLGVPEEHLSGHGWHTYTLESRDGTVKLEFTHNVNGRQVYADGTLDAIRFLHSKLGKKEARGKVYSMIDVLRGE